MSTITFEQILGACADHSADAALRIATELEPIGGPGTPVKPAVYEGGSYQMDKRWESTDASEPVDVVVTDNIPSQANRHEAALQQLRAELGLPELVLDLSSIDDLPAHLPRSLSSWQFPHRAADAYLRDSRLDGVDFAKTDLGRSILAATPWAAGPLVAWFPQALVYGFWQSHLGKKRANTKHARAWVSEIIGWRPATTETRTMGIKGDPINLTTDAVITSNPNDRLDWEFGKAKVEGAKADKLSEMGHGQVPFMRSTDALTPAGVSFARISQHATLSFAQLRRIGLGGPPGSPEDAAARALVAAVGVAGHVAAFGRAFALRSGADLMPTSTTVEWLGLGSSAPVDLPSLAEASDLVRAAAEHAREVSVPVDGWGREPVVLTPKDNLAQAIRATWPLGDD